ncbi:ATP-binding protein [Planctomycetota bacterium]
MYFSRSFDGVLHEWRKDPFRKPLVVRGARQTGKSSAIRNLGAHFELFLELNLERHEDLSLVRSCSSATELLAAVAAKHNVQHFPPDTLLFLDEIQESSEAIQWLRFLHEDHREIAVVAAGSLLDVRLQERGFSFPVGRVTFRTLRPFTFLEFLRARQRDELARQLCAGPVRGAVHEMGMELLREYLFVGGMPEAVVRWVASRSEASVREAHTDLLQAFAEDFQRYRGRSDLRDLEAAFFSLRHHYGRRFKYEGFSPGRKSRPMKAALSKLEGALLVTLALPTSSFDPPFRVRPRSAPKLLPLDVGLALSALGLDSLQVRAQPLEQLLDGRVADMFVGQQLLASPCGGHEPLHFWVSESSKGRAEIDYLLAGGPSGSRAVEVKAGATGTLKSLHQFLWRSGQSLGVRLCSSRYSLEQHAVRMPSGSLTYRLLSLPLYLAERIRDTVRSLNAAPEEPRPDVDHLPSP